MSLRCAALGSAAIGPPLGSLPYFAYFAWEVASRGAAPGVLGAFKAIAAVAFYVPFVLIAAYVAASIPAALVGAGYAYLLNRKPTIGQNRWLRALCAAAIAVVVCALWALTFGQLTIMEYVGKMLWTLVGCGAFAAVVLATFFPKQRIPDAAA
jgi:hypothetical protein